MQVELCLSGQEAIRAVKQKYYDIVFMDHMMPEMDGIEAAAAIRKLKQIPIIALTANAVVGMREMFIENGFNDFLTKPIDVSKLDEMLERWIPKEKKIVGNGDYCFSPVPGSQSLVTIPGVDTAKGMALTGGKEAFYRRVLGLYCKDALERLSRLQTVPESSAMPVFITQVHSLKSASASIGAAEVSGQAAKLEAAGKSGDLAYIKDNLSVFAESLTHLVENIHTALEPAQSAVSDSRLPAFVSTSLIELQAALKSQNAAEIDRILNELNQKQLDPYIMETLEKISDDVLMTEFDNALKSVDELMRSNK
jgi:CheY-like chemotaxis protein